MSAARRVAVLAEPPLEETRAALGALACEVRLLDATTPAGEIEQLAATAIVLWLPHWALLDEPCAHAIEAWLCRGGAARVLLARPLVELDGAQIAYPARVIASLPGAVSVRAIKPVAAPLAARDELEPVVRVRPPRTLSEHLLEVNRQSSVAARLCDLAGEQPSVARLALEPLWLLARALWVARGPRRAVLSRAALEAYRGTLTVAKLWERRMVAPPAAPAAP